MLGLKLETAAGGGMLARVYNSIGDLVAVGEGITAELAIGRATAGSTELTWALFRDGSLFKTDMPLHLAAGVALAVDTACSAHGIRKELVDAAGWCAGRGRGD